MGCSRKEISKNCLCSLRTVRAVAEKKPVRALFFADSHCGSNVGLTPPAYQYSIIDNPVSEEHRRRNKWANLQRECWNWYNKKIEELNPIDKVFCLGDLIDGSGAFSGGTEQITTDRQVQVAIAIEALEKIDTTSMVFIYGTGVHTGQEEDFETQIADHFHSKIGSHEWEKINNCTFDLKHHQSGTKNPFTSLFNEITANREWAIIGEQPKADVLVRAHTHKFCLARMEDCISLSLPALCGYGCLTTGHKILTADLRYVPVETLKKGDRLLGFEAEATAGKKRQWVESIVVANEPIKEEVFEIKLSDGTTLEATGNHPFLNQCGRNQYAWRTVKDLQEMLLGSSQGIAFERVLPVWGMNNSYEAGYLAGFFDGEGCLCQSSSGSKNHAFHITAYQTTLSGKQRINKCYEAVQIFLNNLGMCFSEYPRQRPGLEHNPVVTFRITKGLTHVLKFLGSIRPKRLLEKFDISKLGTLRSTNKKGLKILSIESLGKQTVWALGTTSETYISEGFLSHNTKYGQRRCVRKVNFGFVLFDVWPDGECMEHVFIPSLVGHRTFTN